jgi:hypothetical protein
MVNDDSDPYKTPTCRKPRIFCDYILMGLAYRLLLVVLRFDFLTNTSPTNSNIYLVLPAGISKRFY